MMNDMTTSEKRHDKEWRVTIKRLKQLAKRDYGKCKDYSPTCCVCVMNKAISDIKHIAMI
jgi:hypothetical protein